MSHYASNELWSIFDARRVKAPELKGLDAMVNSFAGFFKNRRPMLARLKAQAARIELLEPQVRPLSSQEFQSKVHDLRSLARVNRLKGEALDMAMAVIREAAFRSVGMRPFPVQLMGALAMCEGTISEMATGEGKTLTAALAASLWGWSGRPVHVITVNDYLVQRDSEEMSPIYEMVGLKTGFIIHETTPQERVDHYRRGVIYCTSKELVADFLRDQIQLGNLRTSTQTALGLMMNGGQQQKLMVPGLFYAIVDEADSLLIDEGVTPLLISGGPDVEDPNVHYYRDAHELALQLTKSRDFTVDRTLKKAELTERGKDRLEALSKAESFWKGKRRREELVTQSLNALHCFIRDEDYLVGEKGKVLIIDENTGRVMEDRNWRDGLHQAVEVKEGKPMIGAGKENLARLSFQRFFRQYPSMGGMTGTAWEAAAELWQIYQRPVCRIPTNRPCIRKQLPVQMFDTTDAKYDAVVARVIEIHKTGAPVLVGTRSVRSSQEVSTRLEAVNIEHSVLNATQTKVEAEIVAQAGQFGKITVATNMAGRGTDIKLGKGIAELGGLHVVATEPHGSSRVDRQLFGRAARQGDPGSAQLFASAEDDLFVRQTPKLRHTWRAIGAERLIKMAQAKAEKFARFNRKQVLKSDDWMDQSLPF